MLKLDVYDLLALLQVIFIHANAQMHSFRFASLRFFSVALICCGCLVPILSWIFIGHDQDLQQLFLLRNSIEKCSQKRVCFAFCKEQKKRLHASELVNNTRMSADRLRVEWFKIYSTQYCFPNNS